MNTRSLFFLVLVSCFLLSRSQKSDTAYTTVLREYRSADSLYNEATSLSASKNYSEQKEDALNRKALEKYQSLATRIPPAAAFDSLRFFTAFKIAELQHYFEHLDLALKGYDNALHLGRKSTLPDSMLFKPYLYAGMIYYNQNRYDTATSYFREAEKIQAHYPNTLSESERLFNILGVLHYEKGDYRQAGNYFRKALDLLPREHPYYKELYVNYRINLAQIHFKLEEYEEANKIYQNLLQFYDVNRNEIHHNMGMINLHLGIAAKALDYFRLVSYSGNKLIRLYNSMGEAFIYLKNYDSARYYLLKSLDAHQRFGANSDPVAYGLTRKNLGDLMVEQSEAKEALHQYQLAILQFYPSFSDTSVTANPENFSGVFSYIHLFNALVAKAEACHHLFENEQQLSWAQNELRAYHSAFKLIEYVERTYNSDEARLFINRIKYLVHAKPIDIAFELFGKTGDKKYLEELYLFDQQNKASILSLQLSLETSGRGSGRLDKENALKSEITRLSLKASTSSDSVQRKALSATIRDKEIELGKFQEQNQAGVEKSSIRIPSVEFVQKQILNKGTALISFHLSPNRLTTLIITKKGMEARQDALPADFHQSILSFIEELKHPERSGNPTTGERIYSFLFSRINLKGIDRLIIIPDDELNYLSFESLPDGKGRYLVQDYAFIYQYSTALLKKEDLDLSGYQTLSFAPFSQNGYKDSMMDLSQLPASKKEIEGLKGEQFTDGSATKAAFLKSLQQFEVLHLATHAVVNNKGDEHSFVAFAPGKNKRLQDFLLYEEEIYQLPLGNSRLIILSACETGAGDLEKGEGVMSLSRAFTYAGCPNIITTLWNANDFSTAYLTGKVHHYLKGGETIDMALQQAKLDYLADKKINPRLKHPFYWAHLVFVGNYSPEPSPLPGWIMISIGVLFLALLGIVLRKKPHL